MLKRHVVLLIVIHPSDGDVKPGGPLGAFREEQAMSRHWVSPSIFLSSSSHTTQLHYKNSYTYSHPNLNFLQHCSDTLPTPNVVCPSGAWFENRPHLTPSIRLARNPKRVIVQWVGIRTDWQTDIFSAFWQLFYSIFPKKILVGCLPTPEHMRSLCCFPQTTLSPQSLLSLPKKKTWGYIWTVRWMGKEVLL